MTSLFKWLAALLLCFFAGSAFAGTSLIAGGTILAAVDGTESANANVRVYRSNAPEEVAFGQIGLYAIDIWAIEVGASFNDYQVSDELITVIEKELNDGQLDHAGYYAVQSMLLDGNDP